MTRARNRLEVQQALVHRAELLDAKLRVRDALPPAVKRPARETQRVERLGHPSVIKRQVVEQRRTCGRVEASVERGDAQVACLGARVSEPRDCLKRGPRPPRRPRLRKPDAKRFDAVSAAIDGVPHRHQLSCLGEQKKQRAIDRDQRVGMTPLPVRSPPGASATAAVNVPSASLTPGTQRATDPAAVRVGAADP